MKTNRSKTRDQKLFWLAVALGGGVAFFFAAYAFRRRRRLHPGLAAQRRPVPLLADLPPLAVSIEQLVPRAASPLIPVAFASGGGHSSSVALSRDPDLSVLADAPQPRATTWPWATSAEPIRPKTFQKRPARHDHWSTRALAATIAAIVGTAALCFAALAKLHPPIQSSAPAPSRIETPEISSADLPNRMPLLSTGAVDTQPALPSAPVHEGESATSTTQIKPAGNRARITRHSMHRHRSHPMPTFAQKTRKFLRTLF
jgi:hypothetical protein